jgi:uncharacterized protein (DUF362 family)
MSLRRRDFLRGAAGGAALVACGGPGAEQLGPDRRHPGSKVAVLHAPDYAADLSRLLREGLAAFGLQARGLRVVLKPNFVEFDPRGVINTHPLLVAAAADAFLGLDAAEVVVAEGPGHRRDNEYITRASGLDALLRERRVRYVDLNFDRVERRPLGSQLTPLGSLYLPRTVLDADLLVSMPKLKTHHWAGVTLSMKNLFGIVPGSVYGWPKNPLHWAGLEGSIVDINSTLSRPRFAIVDGILGMEGNGPIQGTPKPAGVVVMGADFAAVDATCARLMQIAPERVQHLEWASRFLGNIAEERIEQIGEDWTRLAQPFELLPRFARIRSEA